MKYIIPFILVLSLLLSGCSALGVAAPAADATATISPEDIRATADVMVYEMLTQTQAAMPTNTMAPPTDVPPPPATFTLVPTIAVDIVPTVVVAAPIIAPTNTKASTSAYPCTEQPLLDWTGDSVQLAVTNNVKNSTANVYLCITTPYGEAGYISVPVVKSNTVMIPYGVVSATAWVDGEKKDFNASVGFEVKNSSNIQLVIENGRLFFRLGCAPDC